MARSVEFRVVRDRRPEEIHPQGPGDRGRDSDLFAASSNFLFLGMKHYHNTGQKILDEFGLNDLIEL